MKIYDKIYIGSEWVSSTGTDAFEVTNASTEEVLGRIPAGTPSDVDRAVKAAEIGLRSLVSNESATARGLPPENPDRSRRHGLRRSQRSLRKKSACRWPSPPPFKSVCRR